MSGPCWAGGRLTHEGGGRCVWVSHHDSDRGEVAAARAGGRRKLTIVWAFGLWLSGLVPALAQEPVIDLEQQAQQGTWIVLSMVHDGQEADPEVCRSIRRVVTGDHVVWTRDGKPFAGTRLRLHPAHSPAGIDLEPDGSALRGTTIRGIYRRDGATLTTCTAAASNARPTAFEAPAGSGQTLTRFRLEHAGFESGSP